MKKIGVGKIASVMGRYYAMDRDNNYDRVQLAYDAMTEGKGLTAACGICGIQESYDREETDEFVKPTVVVEDGKAVGLVQDKDSVIFFNFRPDRAREITRAFCDDDFKGFDRVRKDITLYASPITILPFLIKKWHSTRSPLPIPSVSGWQPMT